MEWIAKLCFPWLLTRAMKLGAKAFGKVNTRKHAILSRGWMWKHVWAPLLNRLRASENKMDDPLIDFIYVNQACCLEDGSARASIGTIREQIANSCPDLALTELAKLQEMLGMDDNL